MELDKFCRFCAEPNLSLVSVLCFDEKEINTEPNILQKIRYCLPVEIKTDDELPKNVCEECCRKTEMLYDFIEMILTNQKVLKNKLLEKELTKQNVNYNPEDSKAFESIVGIPDRIMKLPNLRIKKVPILPLKQRITEKPENLSEIAIDNVDEMTETIDVEPVKEANIGMITMSTIGNPTENTNDKNDINYIENEALHGTDSIVKCEIANKNENIDDAEDDDDDDDDEENDFTEDDEDNEEYSPPSIQTLKSVNSTGNTKSKQQKFIVVQMTKPATYVCMTCKERFSSFELLKVHIKTSERCKQIHLTCEVCGKLCDNKKALYQHSLTHKEKHTFVCDECGKTYSHRFNLENHKSSVHGEQVEEYGSIYKCKLCNNQYTNRKELYAHITDHANSPSVHLCDTCGKCYNSLETLKSHFRIHQDIRPFPCEHCEKRFRSRPQLTQHLHVHTGVKLFSCGTCNKSFAKKGSLAAHIRIHTGELPYRCTICSQKFVSINRLKTHSKVHST